MNTSELVIRRTYATKGASLEKLLFVLVACFLSYQLFADDVMNGFNGFVGSKKEAFKAQKVVEICASAKAAGVDFVDKRGDLTQTLRNISEGKKNDSSRRSADHFQYPLTEEEITYLADHLVVLDGQVIPKR